MLKSFHFACESKYVSSSGGFLSMELFQMGKAICTCKNVELIDQQQLSQRLLLGHSQTHFGSLDGQ